MAAAHATRVRLFLPPFVTGLRCLRVGFLHSTILPNDFGLAWQFPAVATRARNVVRAWNALGFILANAAVWLIVLLVVAWRLPEYRGRLHADDRDRGRATAWSARGRAGLRRPLWIVHPDLRTNRGGLSFSELAIS